MASQIPGNPGSADVFPRRAREAPRPARAKLLAARVQLDAFRLSPVRYLQALGWRMRGLRLRSRNRFAALAGRSPHAYDLWMARKEPSAVATALGAAAASSTRIIPVVDCSQTTAGLEQTLDSLERAGASEDAVIVSGPPVDGIEGFNRVEDLLADVGSRDCWMFVMNPGDRAAPLICDLYARAIAAAPDASVIYADDDLIDAAGRRHSPHFKPGWNPDLFEHHDFLTRSGIVKMTAAMPLPNGSGDWAATLYHGAAVRADPVHFPFVLHHRRDRPQPARPAKPPVKTSGPRVTVVVPTRNRADLLKTCVEGLRRTSYAPIDIIIVDNGSDDAPTRDYLAELTAEGVQVLPQPGPFNYSILNNRAAALAAGEFLCFLNNDVEIIDPDWLTLLVREAVKPDRGAVGARLLYPDRTIQHAGVILGVGGGAAHAHRLLPFDQVGYFDRAGLPQRTSAVTAACMVVAREKFLAVGGFDEREFPVAFNDVDLCLKLNQKGWHSFYEPRATLIHHESKSRGTDRDKVGRGRLATELAALKRKWHTDRLRDPYHHIHLSPFTEQFVIAI